MTLFEFLTVAVSIVVALGLVRLVDGLGSAIDSASRYWVHLVAVVFLTITLLFYWWSLWLFREGVSWNFGRFAFVVLGALILYAACSVLIPRDPSAVRSWKDHYFQVHRRFFLLCTAWVAHTFLTVLFLHGLPLPLAMVPFTLGIGLNLVGAFSSSERVHQTLAIVIATFVVSIAILWSQPP